MSTRAVVRERVVTPEEQWKSDIRQAQQSGNTQRLTELAMARSDLTVAQFLEHQEAFGGRKQTGVTPATLRTYREILVHGGYSWIMPAPNGGGGSFDKGTVADYLTRTKGRVAEVTYAKIIRHLRVFFTWSGAAYGTPNPLAWMKKVHNPYDDMLPKDVPDRPQVEAMLKACDDKPSDPPDVRCALRRDKFLLSLYAGSGLRRNEVLGAKICDVDPAQRTIRIVGKGGVENVAPITLGTVLAFKKYMEVRPGAYPEDALIVDEHGMRLKSDYTTKLVRRIAKRAGLPKAFGCHSLRHFAARESMRATGDLGYVQKLLRHSTLNMTLKYARMAGVDVQAKHRRFSPID